MSFLNSRGDIFHGVGGGNASVNNIPFSGGGAAGFVTDDDCFYANGDDRWVAYIHNIRTGLNRRAVEDQNDPQFDQSLNHGFAGGGIWAAWFGVANEHRGLYASNGFRLPDAGLMGVGPDGTIGYKPLYYSYGPTKAISVDGQRRVVAAMRAGRKYEEIEPELEADGSIWTLTTSHAYDLQLLEDGRACWQEGLQIRVRNLPQPKQLAPCWRPEMYQIDGVWWVSYYTSEHGIVLHPVDSFIGYRVVPAGVDAWKTSRVLANGTLRFSISNGIGEQAGQLRAVDIDFSVERIDMAAGPAVVLEPTTRPYYLGFFEYFIGQTSRVSSPGNCSLFVRGVAGDVSRLRPAIVTSETEGLVTGAILGKFMSGDTVDQIERQASVSTLRPVAYWDARVWPRIPRLPEDSWLCIQVYQRDGEADDALEADIARELARVPPGQQVALVAQCYTSNATLTRELRQMVGVVNRLANRHPNIVAVLVFSGSGRATGLDDHPEVLPLWLELVNGIPTPTFREYANMPVRPVITISDYAKTLRPNQPTNLVRMKVGDTDVVVRLDAHSNLFVDATNAAGEEHTGRTDRHVDIAGGPVDGPVDPPRPPPATDVVTFYDDIDFKGQSWTFAGNAAFVEDANDRISSIRVPAGKTVVIFEHRDFAGQSMTLTFDVPDLRKFAGPGPDGTWNDAISSVKLTSVIIPPTQPPTDAITTSFRTMTGHLLSLENGRVVATKTDGDGSEQFAVERLDDRTVAIKASNGRYVSAVDGGGRELVASATRIERNERFKPWRVDVGVALEVANGTFVSPQQGGGADVLADGPSVGAWEPLRPSRSLFPSHGRVGSGIVRASGRVFVDDSGPFSPFGTSLFWGLWAHTNDRAKLLANLATARELGADYTRDFGEVGGASWEDRVINPNDSDYRDNVAAYLDLKFGQFHLRTALTIFAGGTGANPDSTVDKIISAVRGREESILYFEVSNEDKLDKGTHRRLVSKLRGAFPSMLVATTSPLDIPEGGLTSATFDLDVANLLIVHTERQAGDEDWRQIRQPVDVYDFAVPGDNNEPPGLQSSVAMLSDPLRLAMLRAVGITSGLGAFVLHTGAGVRGGGAADLASGKFYLPRKANLADYAELPAAAAAILNASEIIPADASNWRKTKGHWPDTQLVADMIWSDDPARFKHGCVRVYGSYAPVGYIENVIGVKDFVLLTQRQGAAHVRAVDPLTKTVVFEKDVADGETFRLEGDKDSGSDAAYIVIGTR